MDYYDSENVMIRCERIKCLIEKKSLFLKLNIDGCEYCQRVQL